MAPPKMLQPPSVASSMTTTGERDCQATLELTIPRYHSLRPRTGTWGASALAQRSQGNYRAVVVFLDVCHSVPELIYLNCEHPRLLRELYF